MRKLYGTFVILVLLVTAMAFAGPAGTKSKTINPVSSSPLFQRDAYVVDFRVWNTCDVMYSSADWTCYDGSVGSAGGPEFCELPEHWRSAADSDCYKKCDNQGNCGVASFDMSGVCQVHYRYSSWTCSNGYEQVNEDPTSCKPVSMWYFYAQESCSGQG